MFWRRRKVTTPPVDDDGYPARVAPQAIEFLPDTVRYPDALMLALTGRAEGALPGTRLNPWANLRAGDLLTGYPSLYSVAVYRVPPDEARRKVKRKRVVMEGMLGAAQQKLGRRPTQAEGGMVQALDAVESDISLGRAVYQVAMLHAVFAPTGLADEVTRIWRTLESRLRAKGLTPQRLHYITERAVLHLQPGGLLFPRIDEPYLFGDEVLSMLPHPSRVVPPAPDALWLGRHLLEGRDVYFSFRDGLDPTGEKPTHNITLILGEQGSGKTTLLRLLLVQRLLQGRAVLSIDPEGENNALVRALGGEVVPAAIPADPETCLLHPLQAESIEGMFTAARFFLHAVLGDYALRPAVTAAVHEAVRRRWERRPGPMMVADLAEALALTQTPEGAQLAAALQPYARGGIWEGFFDRPRALLQPALEPGTWRSFDLTALRDENKAVVMAVLGWFVYHAVTVGRQAMDVFVDEGWYLLRSPAFRDLLDEIGRRGRKRDVGIVFVTHLPSDLARNPTSLSLASTAFIGYLPPDEATIFFRSLGVPEGEARQRAEQVSRLGRGRFMAAPAGGRGSLFPFQVVVPEPWLQTFAGEAT